MKKEKLEVESEDMSISRGRKVSVAGVNYSCELISFYKNDTFKQLQKYASNFLKEIKQLDKGGIE